MMSTSLFLMPRFWRKVVLFFLVVVFSMTVCLFLGECSDREELQGERERVCVVAFSITVCLFLGECSHRKKLQGERGVRVGLVY